MIAPTLHTGRLILRPLAMADYPAYAAFHASDRAIYMGGPHDSVGCWGMFCHDAGLWALMGHGGLMIDTLSGQTIGGVSLNHGPLFPERELGWFLYDGHEGKGYATEAAAALRDWAFGVAGFETLVSYVAPENTASAAVALRLGARLDPDAIRQLGDETDLVFRHLRPEGRA